jgi:HNH endonuclease/AP2 domain-containing protein
MALIDVYGGRQALVDDEDVLLVTPFKWHLLTVSENCTYAATGKTNTGMHRIISGAVKGQVVDHINGNGLDNRRANLRVCTRRQNLCNRKRNANSTQPFKGVSQNLRRTRWHARIGSTDPNATVKRHTIGWFATAEEAARAYDAAAIRFYGEFACLNFPHLFDHGSGRKAG